MLIDNNQFYEWYGHSQPVPEYAVGFETTCGESAQVNRTFVSNLYTRRYSDYAWIQSDHGSNRLVRSAIQFSSLAEHDHRFIDLCLGVQLCLDHFFESCGARHAGFAFSY
jgi:hypothetical protein